MAKNIEPKLKKIGEYLSLSKHSIFVIPEYQRAYSWEIGNCDKLWQDISDYAVSNSEDSYFFGTIIINCQDGDKKLALIDGQQRTTTFLLLLKALLVRVNIAILRTSSDEDSESLFRGLKNRRRKIMAILYKIEEDDVSDKPDRMKDAEVCNAVDVLKNNSINEQYKDELGIILRATDFEAAEANVAKIKFKQKDNRYTNFFKNYRFFYDKIGELSDSQLNMIAKTISEKCEVIEIRSWQVEQAIKMFNSLNSDGLPLYDSDVISAQLYAVAENEGKQKEFSDLWKQLCGEIADLSSTGIADVNSILMQYMYYIRTLNNETISENGGVNVTTPGLRRYFTEINKAPIHDPIKMCTDMLRLAKIWKKVSDYSLVKTLLKFNENSKLFLASYFFRFTEEDVCESSIEIIVECMLKLFALMDISDYGYSSKYFKTFLFGEEVKFANPNIDEGTIKRDFEAHISEYWQRDKVKNSIMDYDKNALVYLNEYLYAKNNRMSFVLGPKYDIEHIMPCSGSNLQEIRKDAKITSEEEFVSVVNKIGNKIILEEKINRSIGNEWFRTKVSTTLKDKTGYIDSQYPIARSLVDTYKDNYIIPFTRTIDFCIIRKGRFYGQRWRRKSANACCAWQNFVYPY